MVNDWTTEKNHVLVIWYQRFCQLNFSIVFIISDLKDFIQFLGLTKPTDGKTFIDIKISNQAGRDIILMSSDKVPPNGLTIIKGVMLDFVKQFTGAVTVTFTAKDVMTGQLIYLNGKKSLTVKASSVKGQKFTIFATTKPGLISTGELN